VVPRKVKCSEEPAFQIAKSKGGPEKSKFLQAHPKKGVPDRNGSKGNRSHSGGGGGEERKRRKMAEEVIRSLTQLSIGRGK